jgi:hypothetical protein
VVSIFRTPRKESFDEVVGVLPTSSRRTHFFLQSSVFVEKKKQKKNFREKHPSNRDRLRQTDRTRRKRRRAGRGAEWRPTMRKNKNKQSRQNAMMILRKMIEKKNIKQKRSAWYTWTTKTVVPNKKLATKKKRRVVVLLEIVVIVVIFFCALCDGV